MGISALNLQLGSRLQMETQVYPKPGLGRGGGNPGLVVEGDWTFKSTACESESESTSGTVGGGWVRSSPGTGVGLAGSIAAGLLVVLTTSGASVGAGLDSS